MYKHDRKRFLWVGGLLLLLAVLGVIVGMPLSRIGDSPEGSARHTLALTAVLLDRHRQRYGSYPRDINQIDALLAVDIPPANVERLHMDPWGQPIIYRFPATDPTCEFDLYSKGANGLDERGQGDDLAVDSEGRRPGCNTQR